MRTIHIIPSVARESSGPSYSVPNLVRSMNVHGVRSTLIALEWEGSPDQTECFKTFALGWGPRRLGRSPAMLRWLTQQVSEDCVDILHNHGMWQINSLYTSRIQCFTGKRISSPRGAFSEWAMKHGNFLKRLYWLAVQRRSLCKMDAFHATSMEELQDIRRLGFWQPVMVVPNGIDLPNTRFDVSRTKKRLLFLGRIHPVKGVDNLIRAWVAVQDQFPDWQLTIAGSDVGYATTEGYLQLMKSLAMDLHADRIDFCGEVLGETKQQLYSESSLFVLPTHSENFGIAVAEALAAGLPAIVTKGAPWSGLVEKKAGWHIDIGHEPLTKAFQQALALSTTELQQMGNRGRDWMKDSFSWMRVGQMMSQSYRWLQDPNAHEMPQWVHLI